jgi:hypothetical protein
LKYNGQTSSRYLCLPRNPKANRVQLSAVYISNSSLFCGTVRNIFKLEHYIYMLCCTSVKFFYSRNWFKAWFFGPEFGRLLVQIFVRIPANLNSFPPISTPSCQTSGQCLKLGHKLFLPDSFRVNIHSLSRLSNHRLLIC